MDVMTGHLDWFVPDQIILFFSHYLGLIYAAWMLMFLKLSAPFCWNLHVLERAWFSLDWDASYFILKCWTPLCHPESRNFVKEECVWRGVQKRATLTSLVLRVRMRSRSSTSCLKVGLWDEMACQQSFIIMYLTAIKSRVYSERRVRSGIKKRAGQGIVISSV